MGFRRGRCLFLTGIITITVMLILTAYQWSSPRKVLSAGLLHLHHKPHHKIVEEALHETHTSEHAHHATRNFHTQSHKVELVESEQLAKDELQNNQDEKDIEKYSVLINGAKDKLEREAAIVNGHAIRYGQMLEPSKSPQLHQYPTRRFGKNVLVEEDAPIYHDRINLPPLHREGGAREDPHFPPTTFEESPLFSKQLDAESLGLQNKNSVKSGNHIDDNVHEAQHVVDYKNRKVKDFRNLSKVENTLSDLHLNMQKFRIFQQTKRSKGKGGIRRVKNHVAKKVKHFVNPGVVQEFMHVGGVHDIPSQRFPVRGTEFSHVQPASPRRPHNIPDNNEQLGNGEAPNNIQHRKPNEKKGGHKLKNDSLSVGTVGRQPNGGLHENRRPMGDYDTVDTRSQFSFFFENGAAYEDRKIQEKRANNSSIQAKQPHASFVKGAKSNPEISNGVQLLQTTIPTAVYNDLSLLPRYEHMTHGDLTVHNQPGVSTNLTKEPQNENDDESIVADSKPQNMSVAFLEELGNYRASNMSGTVVSVSNKHFSKPKIVTTWRNEWQMQQKGGIEIFLYSAYYDDRPALDKHVIRIIGIADVKITGQHCLLWYDDQREPDAAIAVITKIGAKIHPTERTDVRYEPYIFTCDLKIGKAPPQHVSVITTWHQQPTNLLPVQIPVKPPPGEQLEVGQCMSVIYWYHDPTKLVEWLELNRQFGVGEVSVYADELTPDAAYVFRSYAKKGFVNFKQMPSIIDDDGEYVILLNMSPAINDCLYRNMYRYKKIICTDVDEMIVPRTARNYTEMMSQIVKAKPTPNPHVSFMFRNVYFFTDFGPEREEPWFLITQRYFKHIRPSIFGYSTKSITDPQTCWALHNHLCWKRFEKYDNDRMHWTIDVPLELGRNHHYKKCHFDEYLGQLGACKRLMSKFYVDRTMEKFGDQLYNNTAYKLMELKIAEAS